jgi:hypothetical protein
VTASGACPRLGREHVRGGRGSATWSAACRRGQTLRAGAGQAGARGAGSAGSCSGPRSTRSCP